MEKVLIVDDNKKTRLVFKMLLNNYEVFEAENGITAINQYKKYKPNIILMDLQMPLMNGIDATKKIIALNPKAKVIIITALTNVNKAELQAIGAKKILMKPIRKKTLVSIITSALIQ